MRRPALLSASGAPFGWLRCVWSPCERFGLIMATGRQHDRWFCETSVPPCPSGQASGVHMLKAAPLLLIESAPCRDSIDEGKREVRHPLEPEDPPDPLGCECREFWESPETKARSVERAVNLENPTVVRNRACRGHRSPPRRVILLRKEVIQPHVPATRIGRSLLVA